MKNFFSVTDPLVIYSDAQLLCWCVRRRSFFGHLSRLTLSGSNLTTAQHFWYLKPPGNRLMGISRAHESVPRSFSLVHGTDPCTTEDRPFSIFVVCFAIALLVVHHSMLCHALLAEWPNTLSLCLFLPHALNAARPNILFSLIRQCMSMLRSSGAAHYFIVFICNRQKKIGKRRAPAEQAARQTR